MEFSLSAGIMFIFIILFVVDISFNIRRVVLNLDKIWRKLVEINDSLRKI